jgi:antirestriction protein ArdC
MKGTAGTKEGKPMSNVYEIVTDNIIGMLDKGIVPWRKPWTASGSGIAKNAWNKPYRGINVFLLGAAKMMAGYNSNFWVTYNQAKKEGGQVRKGEKGQMVVFWKVGKPTIVTDEETGRTKTSRPFILRYFTVFNLDQIDGMKMTKAMKAEADRLANAEAAIDNVTGRYDEAEAILASYLVRDDAPAFAEAAGDRAFYVPTEDRIQVPARTQYERGEEFYSTAFHECVHSTGHADRLARREHGEVRHFGDEAYSAEELVAEFGSAMLCAESGIDNTIENSAAYIASWSKVLKANPKMLVQAAGKAQKAADFILGTTYEQSDEDAS